MAVIVFLVDFFKKHRILVLFILCLIVFNINFRPVNSGDTIPAALMPFALLDTHTFYFDNFIPAGDHVNTYIDIDRSSYFFTNVNGHYLSIFPIATPLLVMPLYIVPYVMLKLADIPLSIQDRTFFIVVEVMEKVSASIIAALSVVFIFLGLRKLFDEKTSVIVSLLYAFATSTWAIGSQALWQHGMVELILSIMLFLAISNYRKYEVKNVFLMGSLTGLLFFVRPPDIVLAIPVIFYVLSLKKLQSYVCYFLPAVLISLPFLAYNYYFFGSIFGWYENNLVNIFSHNILNAFLALVISPNRGIFIYSPILLLSLAGAYYIARNKDLACGVKYFLLLFPVSIFISVLSYSGYVNWWGGWCYGYRYLIGTLPLYAFLLGGFFDRLLKMRPGHVRTLICLVVLLLIIWSVFVQVVGAFYYPDGSWDSQPSIDANAGRVWDYHDLQIVKTFNAGPFILYEHLNGSYKT